MAHLAQVREIAKPLGIGFLGLGMTPSGHGPRCR